jgi:hypothetical protein
MEYLKKRFRKSPNVVGRKIDDEVVIVPISADLAAQDSIFNLDPAGSVIWQMIDGRKTGEDIRDAMVRTMDVSTDVAGRDLAEFLQDLRTAGAIEED